MTDEISIDEERVSGQEGDFLRVWHRRIRRRPPGGEWSAPFQCDSTRRPMGMDAVAMVLYQHQTGGGVMVGLRASLRPAVALDRFANVPLPEVSYPPRLWEVPAGIVESADLGEAGLRQRAAIEAHEEMGVRISADALRPLGPPFFVSPGVIAEMIHLFSAETDPARAEEAEGDGSPMEADTPRRWLPLEEAFDLCDQGLCDAKTEIALHRLQRRLGSSG